MRTAFLLFLSFPAADAAIQNVTVNELSATQAILRYEAPPGSAACTVEVSENATFVPLVNDVDPSKFASASSDARLGSVQAGGERLFIAGKRAAEIGIDGVRYSRALQTNTVHYYRITCSGAGNTATGTFKTMIIPFGNTYSEAEPGDRTKPGNLAQPHISLSNRNESVIDPQTGLLLKRLTDPRDTFADVDGAPFSVARSSSWNNLSNLGGADGSVATISASTAPLFLGLKTNTAGQVPYSESINAFEAAYTGNPHGAWGYYQAHLLAAVNIGGSAPASADDRKVVVCLTIDGVNCFDDTNQYETTLTNSLSDISFGTKVAGDLWQKAGHVSPNWTQEGTRTGTSMCDGTPNVSMVSGDYYGIHWVTGSAIQINGVDYTVASVINTTHVTLTANCASTYVGSGTFDANSRTFRSTADGFTSANQGQLLYIKGVNGGGDFVSVIDVVADARTIVTHDQPAVTGVQTQYGFPVYHAASNFGILVRKKTSSADTISIDYGYVNYEFCVYFSFTIGGTKLCSDFTVTGPNGNPGYNCQLPGGNLYWIDAETAEAHLFGSLSTYPVVGCASDNQIFSATNPDQYWCAGTGPLYSTTYYGNHSEPTSLFPNGGLRLFSQLPNCNTSPPNAPPYTNQQPCLVTQLVTTGTDIPSLAEAFTANPSYPPAFDKSLFTSLHFKDIDENGNIILNYSRSAGFVIGWVVVFDPNATSNTEGGSIAGPVGNKGCVGGGHPGCIIAAAPGWERAACRWCTYKGGISPFPGWVVNYVYTWSNSSPGGGPYYVPVIDGSANATGNVLDGGSSLQSCPANDFGATGNNCTTLTVASEPLSPSHGAGETGLPGELGPARVGDVFSPQATFPTSSVEQMLLIKKVPGAVSGTWVYTLLRDINHPSNGHGYAYTGVNPSLYTVCNANPTPARYQSYPIWFWNFLDDPHAMNSTGKTMPKDYVSWNDHQIWSHGNWIVLEEFPTDPRCAGGRCYGTILWNNRPFADVVSQPALTAYIASSPRWGKGGGSSDESNMQNHPTDGGPRASPERIPYFFDGRPYRGGFASGSGSGTGSNPATLVSGTLYKFTASAMAALQLPFRKVYPTAAFTGQLPLTDVSSPAQGDVIGTGPADAFKYCVTQVAGECRAGSAVGDTYVNAPHLDYPFCYQAAQNLNLSEQYDLCIAGSPAVRDAIIQVGMNQTDLDGRSVRILTKFARPRTLSVFHTPSVLPNGKWMIFESQLPGDASANKAIMLGKVPPPAEQDNIDRTTFIPITFQIPPHPNSTAYVRFGYAENGDLPDPTGNTPGTFYCTSRLENCVSSRQTEQPADVANPFFFEQTERQSYQPADCGGGCKITVSGVPQRVMYYQVVYTDASGNVTQTPTLATMVP